MDELDVGLIFVVPALGGLVLAAVLMLRAVSRDRRSEALAEHHSADHSQPAWVGPPDLASEQPSRPHRAAKAA